MLCFIYGEQIRLHCKSLEVRSAYREGHVIHVFDGSQAGVAPGDVVQARQGIRFGIGVGVFVFAVEGFRSEEVLLLFGGLGVAAAHAG